jgi:hypothetical protein
MSIMNTSSEVDTVINWNSGTITTPVTDSHSKLEYYTRFQSKEGSIVDLEKSILYNNMLFPNMGNFRGRVIKELCNDILSEIRFEGYKIRYKRAATENMICNLLNAMHATSCIALSLCKTGFKPLNASIAKHHRYNLLMPAIHALETLGYLEIKPGFYCSEGGRVSRLIPTKKLFNKHTAVRAQMAAMEPNFRDTYKLIINGSVYLVRQEAFTGQNCYLPVIINLKKGSRSKPMTIPDKELVAKYEADVNAYNEFISTAAILIPEEIYCRAQESMYDWLSTYGYTNVDGEYLEDSQPVPAEAEQTDKSSYTAWTHPEEIEIPRGYYYPDQGREAGDEYIGKNIYSITSTDCFTHIIYKRLAPKVHRVFNNNELTYGGRFYSASFQSLKCDSRSQILINGESVTELDFKSLHISLLYSIDGKPTPKGDLYDLYNGNKLLRKAVKLMFNIAINAKSIVAAKRALYNKFSPVRNNSELKSLLAEMNKTGLTAYMLLEEIKRRHPDIAHYLHSGKGIELQCLDSQIAMKILNHFTSQGIPCLPVHDSFIIQHRYQDGLMKVMKDAYLETTGFNCQVDIKY